MVVRRSKQALCRSNGLLFTLAALQAVQAARLGQILDLLLRRLLRLAITVPSYHNLLIIFRRARLLSKTINGLAEVKIQLLLARNLICGGLWLFIDNAREHVSVNFVSI